MASSASGQDEPNREMWLATLARARSGLPAVSRKKHFLECHVLNPFLTKFVRSVTYISSLNKGNHDCESVFISDVN